MIFEMPMVLSPSPPWTPPLTKIVVGRKNEHLLKDKFVWVILGPQIFAPPPPQTTPSSTSLSVIDGAYGLHGWGRL